MYRKWQVHLPKWVPWFAVAVLAPAWVWLGYRVLVSQTARSDFAVGVGGWVLVSLVAAAVIVAVFAMAYRGVPALLIHTGPSTAPRLRGAAGPSGEDIAEPPATARSPQHVSIELTARQREQIAAILGRDTDRLRFPRAWLDAVAEDAFLSTDEHLHDLWIVLGLGEK